MKITSAIKSSTGSPQRLKLVLALCELLHGQLSISHSTNAKDLQINRA
ncbi:MAG: hypothetical protein ACOC35_16915 [Promethearchaeia archaeon]